MVRPDQVFSVTANLKSFVVSIQRVLVHIVSQPNINCESFSAGSGSGVRAWLLGVRYARDVMCLFFCIWYLRGCLGMISSGSLVLELLPESFGLLPHGCLELIHVHTMFPGFLCTCSSCLWLPAVDTGLSHIDLPGVELGWRYMAIFLYWLFLSWSW